MKRGLSVGILQGLSPGSFKEDGVQNVWHSALKDGEGTGKPRREHPDNHTG